MNHQSDHQQFSHQAADQAILLDAMATVVGEVSKVFETVKRAMDTGDAADFRRARGAFDGLPGWQKQRILSVAVARAEEVADETAGFDGAAA